MSLYGRFFAASYDRILSASEQAGLAERRRALLANASGRVLELGAGTGANLEYYSDAVTDLVLTEPEEPMAVRLERRCSKLRRPAEIVRAPAERLPFDDASFDVVVATLVLCTVSDPLRALAEIHRVLVPSGKLLFLEHVRSSDPGLARWQDRLNGLQKRFGHGCNCNRPTPTLIQRSAFRIESFEEGRIPKAYPIIRPLAVGQAVAS